MYQRQNNVQIGLLYKSPYHMLIVDLIYKDDTFFTYERFVPTINSNGVICVPVINNKILLIKQSRHALRDCQWCLPRGFGENKISSEENAKKELFEEIGVIADKCKLIGSVISNSGIDKTECDIYVCKASCENVSFVFSEGITEAIQISFAEFEQMIHNGMINDGFTLSAFAFLKALRLEI